MRPRWRTRLAFYLATGIKLGKLAKQPGVMVSEDARGNICITEIGFVAPPPARTDYLDHLEQQNAISQVVGWAENVEVSTRFDVFDQEAPDDQV